MKKAKMDKDLAENKEQVKISCIDSVKSEAEKINKHIRMAEEEKQKEHGKIISIESEQDGQAQFDNSQVGIDKRA
eukprot:16451243-Heterocapsa_arctica.AAC.1